MSGSRLLAVAGLLALFPANGLWAQAALEFAVEEGGGFSAIPGGVGVTFQAPTVNQPVTLRLRVRSLGADPIQADQVTIANARFEMRRLPAFPLQLTRGQSFEFDVTYTPVSSLRVNAPLGVTVTVGTGATATVATFQLGLAGTAPEFRLGYTAGGDGNTLPLTNGTEIAFPSTPTGATSTASFVIANIGSAPGLLNSVAVEGTGFTPLGLPLFPALIPAAQEVRFGVRFTPTSAGPYEGSLTVHLVTGTITASLSGNGAGSRFTFELSENTGLRPIESGTAITFADTGLGSSASIVVRVTNSGDAPGAVPALFLAGNSAFRLADLPVSTTAIAAGGSFTFQILFAPRTAGTATTTLNAGSIAQFPVSGNGVGLSPHSFTGISNQVQELQQPQIGLSLESPYPLPIRGQVTLGFESNSFAVDPALVFSTGVRTVAFQIPAGETEAVFSTGTRQIRFQTGTIAGTILLTPVFLSGDIDITPPGTTTLRVTLPPSRPRLVDVQISSLTQSGVTFQVSGTATTRSISTVEFVFNKIAGSTAVFNETKVTLGFEPVGDAYFRSPESAVFGGQFRVTVPFNLVATSGTLPDLLTVVESATVTLGNREGVSNSMTIPLR